MLFPKPVGEIAKTSILPTTCFKQFLCSSRLASTFGKSLSAVFVASSNSGRDVESVITAISHFSLWSKTLHCWQKLSKSTNQRVYQDLVYRNALLLKILTSVPTPLSPVPLYFSSHSLLRTALHYLNVWNRLFEKVCNEYSQMTGIRLNYQLFHLNRTSLTYRDVDFHFHKSWKLRAWTVRTDVTHTFSSCAFLAHPNNS